MPRKRLLPLVLLGLVVVAGCPQRSSQRSIPTPSAAPGAPTEQLKTQLESLAESGATFPGYEGIGKNIEAVKADDPEKAAALEKDFEELKGSLGNPDQVKAKAKEMLGKL